METAMETVSAVVAALSAGASAALQETSSQLVKDAYAAVRSYMFGKIRSLPSFEGAPDDGEKQAAVGAELQDKGFAADQDFLQRVKALVEELEQQANREPNHGGIDIEAVRAAGNIVVKSLVALEGGVTIRNLDGGADVTIENITAGDSQKK